MASAKSNLIFLSYLASGGFFPATVVYDDGCHLAGYLQNHFNVDLAATDASNLLKQTPFSIDRAHYKNHVGRWCREHMNPDKNPCILFVMRVFPLINLF